MLNKDKNEKLIYLIEKGMFYEDIETYNIREMLMHMLKAKIKHKF